MEAEHTPSLGKQADLRRRWLQGSDQPINIIRS